MIDLEGLLSRRINKPQINLIVREVVSHDGVADDLYRLTLSPDDRVSVNALWCLTHLPKSFAPWLQAKQNELIDRLLAESHPARKRILLQLLREQDFDKETLRPDFIDWCMKKINSECEPYAVRCFSIYCAAKQCRHYPELIEELRLHLDMLSQQSLSPGLKCALRNTLSQLAISNLAISN